MTQPTNDEDVLRQWVGKQEATTDTLHATQSRLMQALLDQQPSFDTGDALPPLWHWLHFANAVPQSGLGQDGHPRTGGFLPPVDLPRRMWAGGRLTFNAPLLLGETVKKLSTIKEIQLKRGRSGLLCFITVSHEFRGEDNEVRLSEEHDIVYREEPSPDAAKPQPQAVPNTAELREEITPSSTMLFRYSALTFNGHRIHYDKDYCRDVEGYPGLVFHGPLTATLLAGLAQKRGNSLLSSFSFRAVAPIFDTDTFCICANRSGANQVEAWAETSSGHLAMTAKAEFS